MVYTVWLYYIVLSILKYLCGVFNFYIFQPSILLVALCVGEIREASTCSGCVGHCSFHIFLTSACVVWSASFLSSSTCTFAAFLQSNCISTLHSWCSYCPVLLVERAGKPLVWLRELTSWMPWGMIHFCGLPCSCSCRVGMPLCFCLSFQSSPLRKCCEKAALTIVFPEVDE